LFAPKQRKLAHRQEFSYIARVPLGPPSKRPRRIDRDQIKADVLLGLMGGLPLSIVARRNGVSERTVENWEGRDEAFADRVAAARSLGWDHLAAECLTISDDRSQDVITDADGTKHANTANVLSRKLMIDTRLRLLSKWDSGRYGDSAKTLRIEGELQQTVKHVIDPATLDPAAREALRALLAHAEAQGLLPAPEPQDAEYEEVLGAEEDVADG
jgi:hypothetical protein